VKLTTPRLTSAVAIGVAITGGACGSTENTSKAAAASPLTLTFPDVVVPAGAEKTQCVVMRLGNAAPIHIGAIHNTLGTGSHHLVVYRVSDAAERRTPFECQPFTDTLDPAKGSPIMVTQKQDDLLSLPSGVAFSLEANQMMRLEMHYLNPTRADRTITATTEVIPISDDDFREEADFLFIGNPDVRIPAKSTATLGPTYFELPSEFNGVKFFAMTGHEHQFGTNVQVATATSRSDPGTMVYDVPDWSWSEPKTEVFATPITLAETGGFKFTCSWNNTSDRPVSFGESANAEMCFFWAYYYPSQGAKVCFNTKQTGAPNGLDVCCPGHSLCLLIQDFLDRSK
jgi:hypothetical protein